MHIIEKIPDFFALIGAKYFDSLITSGLLFFRSVFTLLFRGIFRFPVWQIYIIYQIIGNRNRRNGKNNAQNSDYPAAYYDRDQDPQTRNTEGITKELGL